MMPVIPKLRGSKRGRGRPPTRTARDIISPRPPAQVKPGSSPVSTEPAERTLRNLESAAHARKRYFESLVETRDADAALKHSGLDKRLSRLSSEAEDWPETQLIRQEIRSALDRVGLDVTCIAENLKTAVEWCDPKTGKKDVRAIALAGRWRGYDAAAKYREEGRKGKDPAAESEALIVIQNIFGLDHYPGTGEGKRGRTADATVQAEVVPNGGGGGNSHLAPSDSDSVPGSHDPAPLSEGVDSGSLPAEDR